uniref:Uncharacterized protein n=1 Tax=Ascaris lumbricoides TaxID=6252 RepID=A0A0M3IES7_ASCLU
MILLNEAIFSFETTECCKANIDWSSLTSAWRSAFFIHTLRLDHGVKAVDSAELSLYDLIIYVSLRPHKGMDFDPADNLNNFYYLAIEMLRDQCRGREHYIYRILKWRNSKRYKFIVPPFPLRISIVVLNGMP